MSGDPRDYKLDLSSLPKADEGTSRAPAKSFIGVHFKCCSVYQRIYRSDDGHRYEGRCPRCGRQVRFLVGPGGTDDRYFVVE
jgi:hypothetical protein